MKSKRPNFVEKDRGMKSKKPEEMSNEELIKSEKTIKAMMYSLGFMSILLFVLGIYLVFKKGMVAFIVIPIAFMPIFVINANSLKEIKKEREARGL